ncbi:LacI family DNA-binding transcriptional regulator [Pseudoxanthomonas sp.]|uniref:LacI family DNA-binding transcriptional regulator n=1 Tax=Pseudoxanthomonas sp. TaxID=1871049 RepID=UPI0026312265|nr:LacI family DNA-binding transcriptional regulator [Pseudoxanthomonas sp.]WDS34959.1 MAG: LacI family DNA-binding transcriptional regulator [Pseudoxanthomonas sp.]
MAEKYATLEDVANVVGMSRAQVSRALRGDLGVKPSTRERVVKAATALGYRPHMAARHLASAQSNTVGLAIGEPMNPYHMQLAQALDAELARAGLDSVVSLRALDDASSLRESDRLISLRAAGVLLISTPHGGKAIAEIARRLPCVYLGSSVDHPDVSTVSADDEAGVRTAMLHLIALGHRRIAHIGGGPEPADAERLQTYLQVMAEAGLTPQVQIGRNDTDSGWRGSHALMRQPEPPTAIFTVNDFVAIGAINGLHALGLRVPDDVSVIGFDDIPAASSEMLSLTTLRQNVVEQARWAVQSLQLRMRDPSAAAMNTVVPVELILRRSVRKLG